MCVCVCVCVCVGVCVCVCVCVHTCVLIDDSTPLLSLWDRVGDHLLSVNDISLIGDTVSHAEAILNKLGRGPVRIVAMAPPRDVTRPEPCLPGSATIKIESENKGQQLEASPDISSEAAISTISKHQISSSPMLKTGDHKWS